MRPRRRPVGAREAAGHPFALPTSSRGTVLASSTAAPVETGLHGLENSGGRYAVPRG